MKGVGLAAAAARRICRRLHCARLPLATSLWIGGILQMRVANLAFTWLGGGRHEHCRRSTVAIIAENFTSAIGTVMFVAYLSALCRNPLHTATQYALLTALAAVGRTYACVRCAASSPKRPAGCGSS